MEAAPQGSAEAILVTPRRPTDFVDSSGAPRGSGPRDDVPEYGLLIEAPLKIPASAAETRIGRSWASALIAAGLEPERVGSSSGAAYSCASDKRVDHEDFLERAAKALAWIEIGRRWEMPVWGWRNEPGPFPRASAISPLDGSAIPPSTFLKDQGAWPSWAFLYQGRNVKSMFRDLAPAYVPYETSDAFFELAGRKMILARNAYDVVEEGVPEKYHGLPVAEEALARLGPRVAAKFVGGAGKEAAVEFFDNNGRVPEELGYQLYRFPRLATLFQDVVPMSFEYRFLVVDNQIISGAGVVPELTPEDAHPGVSFDERVRRSARAPEIVAAPMSFISRTHDFAQEAMMAFAEEGVLPGTYTLDVFFNPETSDWGVIELNPIARAGFYAADPEPVLEAVLAAALGERSLAPQMERGSAPML